MNGRDCNITTQNNTTAFKRPAAAYIIIAGLLALALSARAELSLQSGALLTSAACFICAAAALSFVLLYVRVFWVCVFPAVAAIIAVVSGGNVFMSAAVACGVTVFAALYAICHIKCMASFRQFLCMTVMFSALYGLAFCMLLMMSYGSLSEGIRAISQLLMSYKDQALELLAKQGIDYSADEAMIDSLFELAVTYIPAVICTAGVVSAWCMRGFFSLYTRIAGLGSLFNGRQTSAPKPIAVIFVIFGLFGMFFGFLSDSAVIGLSNIISVLSVILLGEGVRLFLASFSKRAKKRASPALLAAAVAALCIFPVVIPLILPYYGAFAIIRERKTKAK